MSLEMGGTVQHVESHRKAPELSYGNSSDQEAERRREQNRCRTFIGVIRRKNVQDRVSTRSKFRIG